MNRKAFRKIFNNTELAFYSITESGSYHKTSVRKDIAVCKADLQPYTGAMARTEYGVVYKEYGIDEKETYKVFCSYDERIRTGLYTDIDNKRFMIRYAAHRGDGMTLILGKYENE